LWGNGGMASGGGATVQHVPACSWRSSRARVDLGSSWVQHGHHRTHGSGLISCTSLRGVQLWGSSMQHAAPALLAHRRGPCQQPASSLAAAWQQPASSLAAACQQPASSLAAAWQQPGSSLPAPPETAQLTGPPYLVASPIPDSCCSCSCPACCQYCCCGSGRCCTGSCSAASRSACSR
jgi:hypothetical protein